MKHIALGLVLIIIGVGFLVARLREAGVAASRRRSDLAAGLAPISTSTRSRAWGQLGAFVVLFILGILFAARVL